MSPPRLPVLKALELRSVDGQRDRLGAPLLGHVERVAALVPPEARGVALLHEIFERADATVGELTSAGLTSTEIAAVRLLTRAPDDSYELHISSIAQAPGPEGHLARVVKSADLHDHLAQERPGPAPAGTPPYRWAIRRLADQARDVPAPRPPSPPASDA